MRAPSRMRFSKRRADLLRTSTSRSATATRQVTGTDSTRQLFVRAETADIGFVWVHRPRHAVEHAQCVKNSQRDLQAHRAITTLDAHQRLAIHTGTVGELVLRQAAEFAPGQHMPAYVTQRPAD